MIAARDGLASPRVLICSAPQNAAGEVVARTLLARWPAARISWAIGRSGGERWTPDPWLGLGVEVVDQADPTWLDERLFLYDLVVLGDGLERQLEAALDRTQPQAPRIRLEDLAGSLERVLTRAGIAPPQTG